MGVNVTGTITDSPACDGNFPSGVSTVDFGEACCGSGTIPATVSTGIQKRRVTSGSYTALDVGTGKSVTLALFLYLRTNQSTKVRLTTVGVSGDVVAVVPVNGLMILQFPTGAELKLLEVDSPGTVEYLACGNQ